MKKKLSLLLCAVMTAALFAGCGSSAQESSDTAATEAADSESAADSGSSSSVDLSGVKLAEDGTLTMGTNATFPPYEYYDGDKIVGIDADIASEAAKRMGLKLNIIDMDFDSLIPAVQSGKIDITLAGMTVNDERKKNVDFSDSYATGVQVIITKEDSHIKSVDDLEGKIIGVQQGTTGHTYCSEDYGDDHVIAFNSGTLATKALVDGKVDCVVIDKEPAKAYVAANEGLKILDTEYVSEDYAAAVSKDNPDLTKAFNTVLQEMKDDGTVDSIIGNYIKADN